MAEIKSTLDLVMERTRHLTMSAEEKAGQQKEEFEKKLKGLLQQYEDNILTADELVEKNAALQADLNSDDDLLVVPVIAHRLQPGKDNAHWLALIKRFAPLAVPQLEEILADNQEKAAALVREKEQHHLDSLSREYGIQGSAIAPNFEKDTPLQEALLVLKKETRTRIEGVFQNVN
jgi:hypothetical protein